MDEHRDTTVIGLPLQADFSSGDQLTKELELYKWLAESKTRESVLRKAHYVLSRRGFSDFAQILLQSEYAVQSVWLVPIGKKSELGLYPFDFMVKHCLISDEPLFETQIINSIQRAGFRAPEFEQNLELFHKVKELGFSDYFNFAFDSTYGKGNRSFFSVSAKKVGAAEFGKRIALHRDFLHQTAVAIDHVSTMHNLHDLNVDSRNINNRTIKLFSHLARGHTIEQAATLCHMGVDNANKKIASVKRWLGTSTLPGAIYALYRYGLLQSMDIEQPIKAFAPTPRGLVFDDYGS